MFDIETHNLSRRFGDLVAVRDLNLKIPRGTIFGFLGLNGAGKSTTVSMLTGLIAPTSGDAVIAGESIVTSSLSVKRKIGVLPEHLALFTALTIWEHLMLVGPIYGLSRHDTEERATQLLTYLDLWQLRHTFVDEASHGMRKKCALAMALIHNPHVLFLDEPFEGIDPVSSRNIKDLLLTMARKGTTVFLTSHILEVVEQLVEGFAIIVNGDVVCSQTITETRQNGESLERLFMRHVGGQPKPELAWVGRE
jgi:ABC-2 type transport system ATP-binding protein